MVPAPDIGIACLGKAVRTAGWDVRLFDAHLRGAEVEAFLDAAAQARPDLIGIKCLTPDAPVVERWCAALKKAFPCTGILVGGPHPTALPEQVMRWNVDFVVRGEGEEPLARLASAWKRAGGMPGADVLGAIPGLVFREPSRSLRCPPPAVLENLDGLGTPAWDLFELGEYPVAAGGHARSLPVLTSRGCPGGCSFCAAHLMHGARLRCRSVHSVRQEIEELRGRFGVAHVGLYDDNLTASEPHALAMLGLLSDMSGDITFDIPQGVRLDTLTEPVLAALRSSGCRGVGVGIESGDEDILHLARKGMTPVLMHERLSRLRHHLPQGTVMGFFIIGFPGETAQEIRRTIRYALGLPLDHVAFTIFTPFPGSRLFDALVASGNLDRDRTDWAALVLDRPHAATWTVAPERLKRFQRFAYLAFYMRPSRWMSMAAVLLRAGSCSAFLTRLRSILGGG